MKKTLIFLILFSLLGCNSVQKINGFGEIDGTCRSYDSINNATFVHNRFNPVLKVSGKWRATSMNSKYYNKSKKITSISNEKDEVLQLIQTGHHLCKNCETNSLVKQHYLKGAFLNVLESKLKFWHNYEGNFVELLETDEESYAIYSLSNTENKMVLFGKQNELFYEFTLYNSKRDKKIQAKLLLNSLKLN